MYFELEDDYYSNEASKNKFKNFQLTAWTKNKLKIAEEQIVQDIVLATTTLLLGIAVAWKYIFQVQVMFVWARCKSFYIYINIIVNKNQYCCS